MSEATTLVDEPQNTGGQTLQDNAQPFASISSNGSPRTQSSPRRGPEQQDNLRTMNPRPFPEGTNQNRVFGPENPLMYTWRNPLRNQVPRSSTSNSACPTGCTQAHIHYYPDSDTDSGSDGVRQGLVQPESTMYFYRLEDRSRASDVVDFEALIRHIRSQFLEGDEDKRQRVARHLRALVEAFEDET
ncbi:hypothetical protein MPH_09540 [Macrophomina phaseolina MS6]|uniref:Uncharacterized protein n=1 Tax=Macrophomina phaseolina (strain MS6) TaxID=1126212 RepID=K2RSQ4_MACPH|nr:hypothetical protein MPH_09540 [Macrophomina phaseolina MS6]